MKINTEKHVISDEILEKIHNLYITEYDNGKIITIKKWYGERKQRQWLPYSYSMFNDIGNVFRLQVIEITESLLEKDLHIRLALTFDYIVFNRIIEKNNKRYEHKSNYHYRDNTIYSSLEDLGEIFDPNEILN